MREGKGVRSVSAKKRSGKSSYSVPVKLQRVLSDRTWLKLAKSPFVDDSVVVGVVEKTWSNPGLQIECRQTFRDSFDTLFKMEGREPSIGAGKLRIDVYPYLCVPKGIREQDVPISKHWRRTARGKHEETNPWNANQARKSDW